MIQANNTTSIDETDGLPMPRRIWAVVSIGFALCMSVLDVNIINIVLPTLSHDFGTSPAVTTWMLSFSSLGEIIGYRKVFLSGIGLFCITSLICALSDSFWTLTIARIFQGFSASAITSVNTAQLRYVYPKSQIGRGMGINAMVVAISAAAGPSVASGILSIASWHWLFAINVPLGITALLLGIKHLPRQEERSKRKFDFVSAIANAVTFGLLIYTLDGFAHHEEMDFLVLQLIILAIVGTFYVRRQLTQTTPLLPLDLLGSIGMALFAVGLFSLSGLTAESSDISIILRLMLCGAGFGLFQTPNNSTIISSAPTKRSGGASGMLGMARLLGQTFGTTLVALLFSFVVHDRSTAVCLMVGSGFAVVAAIVSSLRLSQPSTLKRETNRS